MKKSSFTKRIRNEKSYSDITFLNNNTMPFYNCAMIELYAYGETTFLPGFSQPFYPMVYWTLEYVREGEYQIASDDNIFFLKPGDVLILHPGKKYSRSVHGEVPVKKQEIMMNNSPLISILCNRTGLNGQSVIHCPEPEKIAEFFDRISLVVNAVSEEELPETLVPNTLFALFTELIAQGGVKSIYDSFDQLLTALDIYSPELTLDRMAAHFKVGKRTLNRLFHKHLKCSPCQYLIAKRMKYAVQLLLSNTLPVNAVAEECGYRNVSFFCAEFKKFYGITPLAYRNQLDIFA